MGKWILNNLGPNQKILCVNSDARLTKYYANGTCYIKFVYSQSGSQQLLRLLKTNYNYVVLIWQNYKDTDNPRAAFDILNHKSELPYRQVSEDHLPPDCKDMVVLLPKL